MQTMQQTLDSLIDKFGLAEVLDRLASYSHTQSKQMPSQTEQWERITGLLEEAVNVSLNVDSE